MRRILVSGAVVLIALVAQLTIVNRLALPGGSGPDLVLLAVVALALTGGPVPGMITGFLSGLALDAAPPASHTIGQYALVFCLVGYACGRLAGLGDASPGLYVGISAAAAAVGAVLHAALGIMLSDAQVSWSAVRHVLPPSVIYDVILSPFVLYGVIRLSAWAARAAGSAEGAEAGPVPAGWLSGSSAPATGAVRQTAAAGTPRLHLGERRSSDGWIGAASAVSAAWQGAGQRPGGRREPKMRFGGVRKGAGGTAGLGGGQRPAGRPREPKLRFRGASASGLAGAKRPATRAVPKRMRFGTGRRRDGRVGGGGALRSGGGAVPRFRRRRFTGTIGTGGMGGRGGMGGSLRRSPRRGTFGRRSGPRLRMRGGAPRWKVWRLKGRGTGGYR
jgi:rod shape-determining protein MreD